MSNSSVPGARCCAVKTCLSSMVWRVRKECTESVRPQFACSMLHRFS